MNKDKDFHCNKKKLDKIKAMLIVANAQKPTQKNFNRKEIRIYYCEGCKAWHTTSKKKMKLNDYEENII